MKRSIGQVEPSWRRRTGSAMILALVALIMLGTVGGALIRGAMQRRQWRRLAEHEAQAAWLAAAGEARAAIKLAGQDDYSGEVWDVQGPELGARLPGRVTIQVRREEGDASSRRRRVAVRAEYPLGGPLTARRSQQVTIDVGRVPTGAKP